MSTAAAGDTFKAFIPSPLPPKPPIQWTAPLRSRLDKALLALGRLDAMPGIVGKEFEHGAVVFFDL